MAEPRSCFRASFLLSLLLFFCAQRVDAQPTPSATSIPSSSPSPTPAVFSPQTLADLKRLKQAALTSDYAYRQVAHLSNNIGPRLSGSPQADGAVQYVAAELRKLGLEVKLEKVMVPHWVRGQETAELTEFAGRTPNTPRRLC